MVEACVLRNSCSSIQSPRPLLWCNSCCVISIMPVGSEVYFWFIGVLFARNDLSSCFTILCSIFLIQNSRFKDSKFKITSYGREIASLSSLFDIRYSKFKIQNSRFKIQNYSLRLWNRYAKFLIQNSRFNIHSSIFILHYSLFILYFSLRGWILLSFVLIQKKVTKKKSRLYINYTHL